MRASIPSLHCDYDEGMCGTWSIDYFEATASSVGGVRITSTVRAPGWTSTDTEDYCPEHRPDEATGASHG